MNHIVLARKWRPLSFETVTGQDYAVRTLKNAFNSGRIHHAWLFSGTRGVGKTTLSRILAKCLNCEKGVTAFPCCKCYPCTQIDTGCFIDYLELDAASNRGIDEMIQLLEQVVYLPSAGRFKVYTIDEAHMLTPYAFNAMLKVLEEPPPYVKFILATTDSSKIPVTVLSRCLQLKLKKVSSEAIVERLRYILDQEMVDFEVPAINLIANAAKGSLRDALSILDHAISFSPDNNISEKIIRDMIGIVSEDYLIQLVETLISKSPKKIKSLADEFSSSGLSYSSILADLALLFSRISAVQHGAEEIDNSDPFQKKINDFANQIDKDLVQLFYSVSIYGRKELNLAPDDYAGFLMTCFRMISLCSENVEGSLHGDNSNAMQSFNVLPNEDKKVKTDFKNLRNISENSQNEHQESLIINSLKEKYKLLNPRNIEEICLNNWPILMLQFSMKGLSAELCEQSEWVSTQGSIITIRVAIQMFAEIKNKLCLQNALNEHFKSQIEIKVIVEPTSSFTAYSIKQLERNLQEKQVGNSIKRDPFVQALISDFGGKIIPGTIQQKVNSFID